MAELIASGTAEFDSVDFTLAAGDQVTIFLKNTPGTVVNPKGVAQVFIKSSENNYYLVGVVDLSFPAKVIQAPGTYKVRRMASDVAYGVDKV